MRRLLLAATCLTPACVTFIAAPAAAEVVISDARTTPIATATANGSSADNIRITDKGSIKLTSGVAVTLNSNNTISTAGTIGIKGADGAIGILAEPGATGSITNTGKITIDEDYEYKDSDKDGDYDGPFALGSNRYGIRIAPGGTFTGSISNSGTITVEGNQSAGVAIDSRLVGSFTNGGTISVIGDQSYGLRAREITGDFKITGGAINAKGAGSVAVALDGDIGGAVSIQGSIVSTGYRSNSRPSDTSKLDADDMLQGGAAMRIAGNVAGGLLFEAQPENKDTKDDDEDDDGIIDSKESTAVVVSYGAAPALEIGSAERDIRIGAVNGSKFGGHGIVSDGVISAHGVYDGIAATGVSIGGANGRGVAVAGGITINGTVSASAHEASATAMHFKNGASAPELKITGTVSASGANAKDTSATAILIERGATVTAIRNSGVISALVSDASNDKQDEGVGSAGAIVDHSGTVALVENKSVISGTGQKGSEGTAIDLRANGSGATVRQLKSDKANAEPSMSGSVLFGSGDDVFEVADGKVTGSAKFGSGNNRLSISGDTVFTGNVSFGDGADSLTVAEDSKLIGNVNFGGGSDRFSLTGKGSYRGAITGGRNLAVEVGSGSLQATNTGRVELGSLSVADKGTLGVRIAPEGTTLFDVAGQATFGKETTLSIDLDKVSTAAGRHTVLRAGSLTGAENITAAVVDIPFMYTGELAKTANANELVVEIRKKSAGEVGLSGSRASAYEAVLAALDSDKAVAAVYLDVRNAETLASALQQMLPEHAGGTFETVTLASRATGSILRDPMTSVVERGGIGMWLQQVGFGTSKSIGNTASYNASGWGTAGGLELSTGSLGNFGVSLAYLAGKDADGGNDNAVTSNQFELGGYWRGTFRGFQATGRVAAAKIKFDGTRYFTARAKGYGEVSRTAEGKWNGTLMSAASSLSYEARAGRLSFRPTAAIDYYRLSEGAYTETGGGKAFDLQVEKRTSNELAASGTLSVGYDLMSLDRSEPWMRVELEGGRRQVVGGSLGRTRAKYEGGELFTLQADERTNGWLGKLRVLGGGDRIQLGGEVAGEQREGKAAISARVGLQLGL
jgi:hypothetical protein